MKNTQAPIISVDGLCKTYTVRKRSEGDESFFGRFRRTKEEVRAVRDISFSVNEGELVGFLGPNGAGKTTTLKMLSGILYPSSGSAQVMGHVPWDRKPEYQRQFALVMGQKNQLWWDLPARDSFRLNKIMYEVPDEQYEATVTSLSELLGVTHVLDTPVRKLSLGERMKCELIAALLHQPRILFLDEPTIGLDVVSQQAIRDFIREYNQKHNTTILLTSHYMEDVEALCDRVIVIDDGAVLYDGALDTLVTDYTDKKIVKLTFTEPIKKADLGDNDTVRSFAPQRAVLELPRDRYTKVVAELLKRLPIDDILIDEVEIEEVIRDLFQHGISR